MTLSVTLVLAPRAASQLQAEAQAAVRSHSYLSHGDYLARHAPLQTDYDNLKAYVGAAKGVQVTRTSSERNSLEMHANVADFEQLFGTAINRYTYQGRQFYANPANPRLPLALAPLVQRVAGLENATILMPKLSAKPASATSPGNPPYAPADTRTGYNVADILSAGLTGSGQMIGL